MANIRSEYIKNLMEDKEELNKSFQETTKEALKGIVDEAINKNLRSMISESEDEDKYDEEEVDSTEDILDNEDEDLNDETESGEEEADDEGEEIWDSIEDLKDDDGEYDLTGMDSSEVVKVLKVMKPEDGVRVVKNDDGSFELKDADNEYIIELGQEIADEDDDDLDDMPEEPEFDNEIEIDLGGDDDDDEDDEDTEFEIVADECNESINEGNVDLGYTDNYQKKTAMTTPPNNEPANPKSTRSWDKGAPKGTEKPWVGNKGNMAPFEIIPENVDEGKTVTHNNPGAKGTSITELPNNKDGVEARNCRKEGEQTVGTGESPTKPSENSSFQRKANAILKENKELKAIAEQIRERLNEACVINASLGKIIKLVTENSTTKEEKINIVNRFNNVKTVNEGKELYKTISEELRNSHPINNVDKVMNVQLAESKRNDVVETSMYKSQDLANTISLMQRLDKIK